MALYPTSGCRIFIGTAALDEKSTDFVDSDFSAVVWQEIAKWTQMGPIGDTAALISTDVINEARTKKQKGTRNAGSMDNVFAVSPLDAGQLAIIAAEKTLDNYPFMVRLNDGVPDVSAPVTISIASPGVVTWAAHGRAIGQAVSFQSTGALPTGLVAGTTYYILATGFTTGAFQVAATPGGTAIVTTGTQSGIHTATVDPAPSLRKFVGLVMTAQETAGAANTIRNLNSTVEINSNIVRVARDAA